MKLLRARARERGFRDAKLRGVRLLLTTGDGRPCDYVEDVLAPRGIVPFGYEVTGPLDAARLMGMLPPP